MNARTLERLFLRFAVCAAPLAGVGCSSPGAATPTLHGGPGCGTSTGQTQLSLQLLTVLANEAGAGTVGGPPSLDLDAGAQIPGQVCFQICADSGVTSGFCSIKTVQGDTATIECFQDCTGRRPDGLIAGARAGVFAEMARLEAASVFAFRRLRAELAHHRAPRSLLRACSRAARDEVRHARATRALARRYRQRFEAPVVEAASPRSLEALAIENAVEGCVRETWGAFEATRTAESNADRDVRAAMKRIARDETRHAALAWALASWLEPRLGAAARARVRAARDNAAYAIAARATPNERPAAAALWSV